LLDDSSLSASLLAAALRLGSLNGRRGILLLPPAGRMWPFLLGLLLPWDPELTECSEEEDCSSLSKAELLLL
jgi:hypothetical protein